MAAIALSRTIYRHKMRVVPRFPSLWVFLLKNGKQEVLSLDGEGKPLATNEDALRDLESWENQGEVAASGFREPKIQ